MFTKTELKAYEQMGMAALLPGMQHMLTLMQEVLDGMRRQLAAAQEAAQPAARLKRRPGRPAGVNSIGTGWPADPAARKREMARRQAVRRGEAPSVREALASVKLEAAPTHPRDPRHPRHEEWRAKVSKARKKAWRQMSPDAREAHLKKMAKGQKAKHGKPNGLAADA